MMSPTSFNPSELSGYQRQLYFRWQSEWSDTRLPVLDHFALHTGGAGPTASGKLMITETRRNADGVLADFVPVYLDSDFDPRFRHRLLGQSLWRLRDRGLWDSLTQASDTGQPQLTPLRVGLIGGTPYRCTGLHLPVRSNAAGRPDLIVSAIDDSTHAQAASAFLPLAS